VAHQVIGNGEVGQVTLNGCFHNRLLCGVTETVEAEGAISYIEEPLQGGSGVDYCTVQHKNLPLSSAAGNDIPWVGGACGDRSCAGAARGRLQRGTGA